MKSPLPPGSGVSVWAITTPEPCRSSRNTPRLGEASRSARKDTWAPSKDGGSSSLKAPPPGAGSSRATTLWKPCACAAPAAKSTASKTGGTWDVRTTSRSTFIGILPSRPPVGGVHAGAFDVSGHAALADPLGDRAALAPELAVHEPMVHGGPHRIRECHDHLAAALL